MINTARNPLVISSEPVRIAQKYPAVRAVFRVLTDPEPSSRTSYPVTILTINHENGIEPKRNPIIGAIKYWYI